MFVKSKLLRIFAQETFGEEKYYPVFHGEMKTTKPFALVVKRPRCIWKRPFARTEFVILDGLEKYVKSEEVQKFLEEVKSKVTREDLTELKNTSGPSGHSRREGHLEVGEAIKGKIVSTDDLGYLELGKVSQEYITDPDLRDILAQTALEYNKVNSFEDSKLLLITSVVYSEKLEVHGCVEQETQLDLSGQANLQLPPKSLKPTKIGFSIRNMFIPPGMAARCWPGPILMKCCRVEYNREKGLLEIPKGEYIGKSGPIPKGGMDEDDDEEWDDVVTNLHSDETDLPEYFTPDDVEKLEIIKREVLMTEATREQRKARVSKYRRWFEEALLKKNQKDQKVLLTDEPLTEEECKFLSSIPVSATSGQSILDLSTLTKDIIQGYGIVLKTLENLPDEEWTELEKTFTESTR